MKNFRSKMILLLLFVTGPLVAQKRLAVESGKIEFTSDAPMELIKASTEKVKGMIDPDANTFAFVVDVKSFTGFNSTLQQQHFNERYMESQTYPEVSFTGHIIDPVDFFKNGTYQARTKGQLNIHGKKQVRMINNTIVVEKGMIVIESNFSIPLADHDIKIPKVVSQKIASEVFVKIRISMKEKAGK
jgi:hypothetical protein